MIAPTRRRVQWPQVIAAAAVIGAGWWRPDIAAALILLGAAFTLVEHAQPLRAQRPAFRRVGAATDATSFIVDEVLAALGTAAVLAVTVPLSRLVLPSPIPGFLASQPAWLRWAEAFALSEVSGYWGHRLSHQVPTLWRFHRVHHSSPQLDWLAPNRRHPIDLVVARVSSSLPVLVLGFAAPAVVGYFAVKRIQGLLVHANVRWRFGWLERVFATPFFHHWHHSAEPGTWNSNYAGTIPAVDWLFGTLRLPDRWPQSYGCDAAIPDTGYVARLASPWTVAAASTARPRVTVTRR